MSSSPITIPETVAASPAALLEQARALAARGETLRAESLCLRLLQAHPDEPALLIELAEYAAGRDDTPRAIELLGRAHGLLPDNLSVALALVRLLWSTGDLRTAQAVLETGLRHAPRHDPDEPFAWLLLGQLRRQRGLDNGAARAWHQATRRARERKLWRSADELAPPLWALLGEARQIATQARREHLQRAYAQVREQVGSAALQRIDEAVQGLTEEPPRVPEDTRQRPLFLYVPGLPSVPFLDPDLQPWARRLREAFPDVRREALELFESRVALPGFIDFDPGARMGEYLGGKSDKPAWDAYFFYRRGERYADNHARCPATSALLESIDLFRVEGQSPEICFSFLAPQTTIMPHHGVSNVRLVMHLPLRVPRDCALELVGVGKHVWREGEPVLFDDTYLHAAENHSDETRIVLLMDCWNPHLTLPERAAVTTLIQAIGEFDQAL